MATWVITGANRGLGLEFTKQLLDEGHTVVAGVREPQSMPFNHETMTVIQLDVSSTESVQNFAKSYPVSEVEVLKSRVKELEQYLDLSRRQVEELRESLLALVKNNDQ